MMDSSANRQFEQKSKKLVKAFASSESGKTRVLLVGADWYYMCSDLSCAFSDVEELHTQLLKMYTRVNRKDDLIFSCLASQHDIEIIAHKEYSSKPGREEARESNRPEVVHVLRKFEDYGAYNLATWKIINYYLEKLYEEIEKEDSVLIYFAGHGAAVDRKSYFFPLDAIQEDLGATINVECAVSIDEIIKKLSEREAKCKWLVVDTCRTVMNGIKTKQDTGEFLKTEVVKDVVVFQSCSSGESSQEDPRRKHGAFSDLFLNALRGAADEENKGYITIGDVWKYVSEEMKKDERNVKHIRYHNGYCKQNPDCNINDFEDFVICGFLPLSKTELKNAKKKLKKAKDLLDKGEYEAASGIAQQVMEITDRRKNGGEIYREAEGVWGDSENFIDKRSQDEYQKSSEKNKNERSSFLKGKVGSRKTIDVRGQKFTFCFCPPGKFMMGSPEDEKGHKKNERQHEVTFAKGFWMLESEVTQAQWEAIMENNPSYFKEPYLPNRPVDSVSLVDCQIFIEKLNKLSPMQDGFEFKLPTESQWEYACRAGSKEAYSGELDEMGWYYDNAGMTTHEVKGKKPNAWGLYDMHGNLYEWCSDGYEDYPSGSVTDHRTPSSSFGQYVNRGGKYSSDAVFCRSAFRGHNAPWDHDEGLGVRIILELSDHHYKDPKFPKETVEIPDFDDVPKSGSSRKIKLGKKSWVFRYCEPGEFDMGSPDDEKGRSVSGTRRRVSITHGFWMLETPVTQDLYYAVRGENPSYHQGKEIFNGKEEFVEYPVENVNWHDSRLFAKNLNNRLSKKKSTKFSSEGELKFRLPTEAEWEYACRAGEKGASADDLEKKGWYKNNSDGHTHRVKSKDPNDWGLYDMHGNVGEWCLDEYQKNLGEDEAVDPLTRSKKGSKKGTVKHVVRSGDGFAGDARDQQSFSRMGAPTKTANSHIGFRLVLSSFDPEGNSGNGAEAESNH